TPFLFDSFFFAAPSDKEKAAVGACHAIRRAVLSASYHDAYCVRVILRSATKRDVRISTRAKSERRGMFAPNFCGVKVTFVSRKSLACTSSANGFVAVCEIRSSASVGLLRMTLKRYFLKMSQRFRAGASSAPMRMAIPGRSKKASSRYIAAKTVKSPAGFPIFYTAVVKLSQKSQAKIGKMPVEKSFRRS
ncbi:MAG: hypothetical protein IJY22_08260, partial [Clostridia bacterium]|nr:hypothetical protein [Clostridia bacterium]